MPKPWEDLSAQGQCQRLHALARNALPQFGIDHAQISPIANGQNATFRVVTSDSTTSRNTAYKEGTFLLRLHGHQPSAIPWIQNELDWLAALRQANLIVPEPLLTPAKESLVTAQAFGTVRPASLMKWMNGRFHNGPLTPQKAKQLGILIALLHQQSATWQRPPNFSRGVTDWTTQFWLLWSPEFRPKAEQIIAPENWKTVVSIAEAARSALEPIPRTPENWGLIHADLHNRNVLYSASQARPIDFDDARDGYWLHDLVVVLAEASLPVGTYPVLKDFLKGYQTIRPFPPFDPQILPILLAGRLVETYLWVVSRSFTQPRFQGLLNSWGPELLKEARGWIKAQPPIV